MQLKVRNIESEDKTVRTSEMEEKVTSIPS